MIANYCSECGYPNKDIGANFCSSCGNSLTGKPKITIAKAQPVIPRFVIERDDDTNEFVETDTDTDKPTKFKTPTSPLIVEITPYKSNGVKMESFIRSGPAELAPKVEYNPKASKVSIKSAIKDFQKEAGTLRKDSSSARDNS